MHSMLFVDNDITVLDSMQKLFSKLGYQLYFATDGEQALKIMSDHAVEMVITDLTLPNMSGHQLLLAVQKQFPQSVRIITGGSSWEKECRSAVLDGSAKLHILEPFDQYQMLDTVKHLFDFRDMMASENILDIINQIDQLPAVTDIYNRVCRLVESDAGTAEIAAVIELDPAISAKILQLINSVYFNKKISSLKQAVTYLGLNAIKNLVLTTSIFNYVSVNSTAYFNQLFSKQAILTGIILEFAYKSFYGKRLPDDYMTAGLLHDIGMIVMQQHFAPRYVNAFRLCSLKECPFLLDESRLFSVNHQSIGGYLLEWWGIPYPLVESCLFHHDPLNAPVHRELVCAVHLADYYSWSYLGREDLVKLDDRVFDWMGLDRERCENLITDTLLSWEADLA